MVVRLSTVFLAHRLMLLVTIRLNFPASASCTICVNPLLCAVPVPLIPASVYMPAKVQPS